MGTWQIAELCHRSFHGFAHGVVVNACGRKDLLHLPGCGTVPWSCYLVRNTEGRAPVRNHRAKHNPNDLGWFGERIRDWNNPQFDAPWRLQLEAISNFRLSMVHSLHVPWIQYCMICCYAAWYSSTEHKSNIVLSVIEVIYPSPSHNNHLDYD